MEGISEDIYVGCPAHCGEAVHVRELDDHMELHEVEGLGFDGASWPESSHKSIERPHSRRSPNLEPTSISDITASGISGMLTVPSTRGPPDGKGKENSMFGDLKELFLGPAPRKTRPILSLTKPGTVKRLGVSFCISTGLLMSC